MGTRAPYQWVEGDIVSYRGNCSAMMHKHSACLLGLGFQIRLSTIHIPHPGL